jgi:hypothetical protein
VRSLLRWVFAAALMAAANPASGQSLGEVAQKEQSRRAAGTKSVKSFSNADLKPHEIVAPASPTSSSSPASCYMSLSEERCVTPEELIENSRQFPSEEVLKAEPHWRRAAANLRTEIERVHAEIDSLGRVVANENRVPNDRRAAEESIAKLERRLENLAARWQRLEKQAADVRVPAAWLAPAPQLRRQ